MKLAMLSPPHCVISAIGHWELPRLLKLNMPSGALV